MGAVLPLLLHHENSGRYGREVSQPRCRGSGWLQQQKQSKCSECFDCDERQERKQKEMGR